MRATKCSAEMNQFEGGNRESGALTYSVFRYRFQPEPAAKTQAKVRVQRRPQIPHPVQISIPQGFRSIRNIRKRGQRPTRTSENSTLRQKTLQLEVDTLHTSFLTPR